MLVIDQSEDLQVPRGFHTNQEFIPDRKIDVLPIKEGLENFYQSGSAQFSERTLKNVLPKMKGQIWIIDLRQESHGFINGLPVSWYYNLNRSNENLNSDQVLIAEKDKLALIKKGSTITLHNITKKAEGKIKESEEKNVVVNRVDTEQELVNKLGVQYIRLASPDHHRPSDEVVDQFITFHQHLPKDAWLHFHCRGGRGRTTTFMVMNDILHNGKKLPLQTIVAHQILIGGKDLFKISIEQSMDWKREPALSRGQFIESFYQYAISPQGYPKTTWSHWSKLNSQ